MSKARRSPPRPRRRQACRDRDHHARRRQGGRIRSARRERPSRGAAQGRGARLDEHDLSGALRAPRPGACRTRSAICCRTRVRPARPGRGRQALHRRGRFWRCCQADLPSIGCDGTTNFCHWRNARAGQPAEADRQLHHHMRHRKPRRSLRPNHQRRDRDK